MLFFKSFLDRQLVGMKVLQANLENPEEEDDEEEDEEEEVEEEEEESAIPPTKKVKLSVPPSPQDEAEPGEQEDIEAQLQKLEKQRAEKEVRCGICNGSTAVIVSEKGDPFIKCNLGCRFPWQTLAKASQTHVVARHKLEDRFRPSDGGALPRCPRHREIAALMLMDKCVGPETAAIKGHLFFICTNPVKNGGPCMNANGGRWSVVASVRGDGKAAKELRKKLENLYALDGALRKKRNEEARNTVNNIMAESEKDFQYGTGIFADQ